MQNQFVQSLGQFLIVFVSGMAIYKGWSDVVSAGVMNAIYQPVIQGLISALGIWGFSKVGPKKEQP